MEGYINGKEYQAPHCDSNVLHAPGKCIYCDHFPERQRARQIAEMNFTGEQDPNKSPCPAEHARPLETINRWGGNIPMTKEIQEELDRQWAEVWTAFGYEPE